MHQADAASREASPRRASNRLPGRRERTPTTRQAVLDPSGLTLRVGTAEAVLNEEMWRLLTYLAETQGPVPPKEIAAHLGLRSTVDVVSVARARVNAVRTRCRTAGITDIVHLVPRKGYALDPHLRLSVATRPAEPAPTEGLGGSEGRIEAAQARDRASTVARRLLPLADLRPQPRHALEIAPLAGERPLLRDERVAVTRFGVVDFGSRAFVFRSSRLSLDVPAHFTLLAAVMMGDGAYVEEAVLLHLCRYDASRYGPAVLRRYALRLNRALEGCGAPFRVATAGKRYGSPYRAVDVPSR